MGPVGPVRPVGPVAPMAPVVPVGPVGPKYVDSTVIRLTIAHPPDSAVGNVIAGGVSAADKHELTKYWRTRFGTEVEPLVPYGTIVVPVEEDTKLL